MYTVDPTVSITEPDSDGPKIQGVEVTGYDKTDIRSPVARVVMSENTLERFRSDASRRSTDDEEGDLAYSLDSAKHYTQRAVKAMQLITQETTVG